MEEDRPGLWGEPTATIDWCEANYEVTYYIAEFWNTISNLSMIILPIVGAVLAYRDGLEPQIWLSHLSLLVVGIGSWCFHGTLLYGSQLLDELPMIWGSAVLLNSLYHVTEPPGKHNKRLMVFLFLYCAVITGVYVTINKPVFHEVAYACMVFVMIFYAIKILRVYPDLLAFWLISIGVYGMGFVCWLIDNHFCVTLRSARSTLGYPLKPFLQGHAWWHIMAGVGTYYGILFASRARCRFLKRNCDFKFAYGLPTVRSSSKLA